MHDSISTNETSQINKFIETVGVTGVHLKLLPKGVSERWISGQEFVLLPLRTRVQFLASVSGSSQLPAAPAPAPEGSDVSGL